VAAISKRFELESWDWAHSLRLFKLFPIVIKSLVLGGKGGVGGAEENFVIVGLCNSRIKPELVL
jgi:hypothetical protein